MSRNVFHEGLKAHFSAGQIKRLASVRVGIAGAGGLGSNVAGHLVRSGIRRLTFADFDRVAASNLNRQFYFQDQLGMKKVAALRDNLRRINPDLDVEALDLRLTGDNIRRAFGDCDLIVEALDRSVDKKMMAERFMADSRPLICVSGIGGWGDSDRILTRRCGEGLIIIGDGRTEVSAAVPPTSAIVGIAAAKQADMVIEILLGANPAAP